MAEAKRAPVVSADEMRARLATLRQESAAAKGGLSDGAASVGSPTTDAQLRYRARVVLLDYFDLASLRAGRATPTPDPHAPGSKRSFLDRVRAALGGTREPATTTAPTRPPVDPAETKALDEFATRDCDLVTTRQGTGLRLRLPVRHATLRDLGVEGLRRELDRPDAIRAGDDDVTHRMARRLIEGERELSGLSAAELSGILRAVEWLAPLGLDLPTEPAVRAALDLANVLAPLRAVAGPDFVGRERELELLEDHLYQPVADGATALALHGPGGVGKSTLLARFVLDHVGQGPHHRREHPLLFSYLSFDRAELDAQYPLTLLGEAARQMSLQAPELGAPLAHVRQEIDELLAAQTALRNEATAVRGSSKRDVGRQQSDAAKVAGYFAEVVGSVTGTTPILVVLDTFEMAQRRSRSFLRQLDEALHRMQRRLPALRVVVAGRAPVEELTVRNMPLEGLDEQQSTALLTRALRGHKVDPALVRLIVDRVSGNPLSLRLAADLVIREGSRAISSGRGRRRLLYDLRAEQVQGVLYRRILDHVDTQVRPLANPGLVVRQITPDVIREVLAEPCGLGAVTPERAAALFELLRREVALVTEARPGLLVHRTDVRREMLPLLEAEDADRVTDIHERAVRYYEGRSEIDDHVEHLYHRLMLGQPTTTLDAHWHDAAATFLEDAWDELPPEARVYLAGRLGTEADPADLAAADRTAWIRQATSLSRALLDAGQPGQALAILRSRELAPRELAVTRLVVEALAAQGHEGEALAEAQAAIAEADERGLGPEFVQLNLVAARVAEDCAAGPDESADYDEARRHYQEARLSAVDFGARVEAMTAGVGVLRIARRSGLGWRDDQVPELRAQLVAEAETLTEREKSMHPALLRDLAAELGDELPWLLVDAARHVGVEAEGASASQLPEAAQQTLRKAATRSLPPQAGSVLSPSPSAPATPSPPPVHPPPAPGPIPKGSGGDGWTQAPAGHPYSAEPYPATSSSVGQSVADALATSPGDDELKESLKGYWQSEADRPAFDYDEEGEGDRA
ncbi:AAA family ATPase [Intrasporangium sp.]|uniref:AAA family ATPase n=1 Tax=Intrasporangium sp. TaxID=1925024 RepID=UPI00293B2D20|nr:AAA family ATPase [Intrasporangium sp.]MDV3222683.1 AAA family ATPase [Intrasporangium sp.]